MKHADKLMHFGAGALVALIVGLLLGVGVVAFAAALFVGIGKELLDKRGTGTPSVWDVVATAAPGLLVWVLIDPGAFAGFA